MKQIHWKASARTQHLQVKLQEPSTSIDVLLFLNIITFLPEWQGIIPELLEELLSVAASLTTHYYSQGMRVGLYVNSAAYGSDQQVMFHPAHHPAQMRAILESLAQSNGFATITMEQLIKKESANLPGRHYRSSDSSEHRGYARRPLAAAARWTSGCSAQSGKDPSRLQLSGANGHPGWRGSK